MVFCLLIFETLFLRTNLSVAEVSFRDLLKTVLFKTVLFMFGFRLFKILFKILFASTDLLACNGGYGNFVCFSGSTCRVMRESSSPLSNLLCDCIQCDKILCLSLEQQGIACVGHLRRTYHKRRTTTLSGGMNESRGRLRYC